MRINLPLILLGGSMQMCPEVCWFERVLIWFRDLGKV